MAEYAVVLAVITPAIILAYGLLSGKVGQLIDAVRALLSRQGLHGQAFGGAGRTAGIFVPAKAWNRRGSISGCGQRGSSRRVAPRRRGARRTRPRQRRPREALERDPRRGRGRGDDPFGETHGRSDRRVRQARTRGGRGSSLRRSAGVDQCARGSRTRASPGKTTWRRSGRSADEARPPAPGSNAPRPPARALALALGLIPLAVAVSTPRAPLGHEFASIPRARDSCAGDRSSGRETTTSQHGRGWYACTSNRGRKRIRVRVGCAFAVEGSVRSSRHFTSAFRARGVCRAQPVRAR